MNNRDFLSSIHPYMGMEDKPGKLYIANVPKVMAITKKVGGVDKVFHILCVPYVEPGRFMEAINLCIQHKHAAGKMLDVKSVSDFALIFAHQEFKGAPLGPVVSTKGDEWPSHYPMVVSGHIH